MNASGAVAVPIVTSLPASPTDGQEIILADSTTAATYAWQLRYNANAVSSYKWDFVGGSQLAAEVTPAESTTSTSYTDLATTAGQTVTTPVAGDYDIQINSQSRVNSGGAAAGQYISYMTVKVGSNAASDAEANIFGTYCNVESLANIERTIRKTGLAASTALVLKFKSGSGTSTFANRRIAITPVRVG